MERNPNLSDTPPFNRMADDAFEEMCCSLLAAEESVVTADLYGRPREAQYGIDVIGRSHDETSVVISCKCYTIIRQGMFAKWSNDFLDHLDGIWAPQNVKCFILAVAADVKSTNRRADIDSEKSRFKDAGLCFEVWGPRQLQEKLRPHPGIVAQYLGMDWVENICGLAVYEWNDPKKLMEQRYEAFLEGRLEEAIKLSRKSAKNAEALGQAKSQINSTRALARDLSEYLIGLRRNNADTTEVAGEISEALDKLELLGLQQDEMYVEKALFARIDGRPTEAITLAGSALKLAEKPETKADALIVQMQASWLLNTVSESLSLAGHVAEVARENTEGDAALALMASWTRTLLKSNSYVLDDITKFVSTAEAAIDEIGAPRCLIFLEDVTWEASRLKDQDALQKLLDAALGLAQEAKDFKRVSDFALQLAQLSAERDNDSIARQNILIASNSIDKLRTDEKTSSTWASLKATYFVMLSRVDDLAAECVKETSFSKFLGFKRSAYSALENGLEFISEHLQKMSGEVEPFVSDTQYRAGKLAADLGLYSKAKEHFSSALSDSLVHDPRYAELATRVRFGLAEALMLSGQPELAREEWTNLSDQPNIPCRVRDGAQENIRFIDESVTSIKSWIASDTANCLRTEVASEREGLRQTLARQIRPFFDWVSDFGPETEGHHANSELYDIWGRGGFCRVVACLKADPLNAICVDARSIVEISTLARVFCPIYESVVIVWKGAMHPALGIVPMPDHLGPTGNFGGQGYIRTSDGIKDKDGWHAAMGWANYIPKEVSSFLVGDAAKLIKSGRLILLPAPLIGCTQSETGWTDNLFTDGLLNGIIKSARHDSKADSPDADRPKFVDLGAIGIPYMEGVALSDLDDVLSDHTVEFEPLRKRVRKVIGNRDIRSESWNDFGLQISDVRDALFQLDDLMSGIVSKAGEAKAWNLQKIESNISAMERSELCPGSDPITDQLQALGNLATELQPWVPYWRLKNLGGKVGWSSELDACSEPPDTMARMQGFNNSVTQGWLYPGDGGPGMATAVRLS